ncbi:MAG: epoxyqueuosine reductase [Candidatus Lokiarchaeota archaeon]|nr:epoxyqueuosine reductase [Candidatus Lokiarchaeota archaeon]
MKNMNISNIKNKNTSEIKKYFFDYLKDINYKGIFGIANFSSVFNHLISEQQNRLKKILKDQFHAFITTGSIISIGICYDIKIIENINHVNQGIIDKDRWEVYGNEYDHINNLLRKISSDIALIFNGIAIPPTTETPPSDVTNVTDYFAKTISHRVVAEFSGLGWRGKNKLLINEKYGPAVRFASILINIPLLQGRKRESECFACRACLDICPILNNKQSLDDYREHCRKYHIRFESYFKVCGKCIKACIYNSIYKDIFYLKE